MNPTPEPLLDQWSRESRKHLDDAGEHYFEHLLFTLRMGGSLILTGLIIIAHGLIPALFTTTGSARIEKMYLHIRDRVGKTRAEQLDQDWQI